MQPLALSFLFIFCFLGILVTAYFSIESIKALADRFRLSDTFVGAVFLSVGTSFPEFVNSIVSGFVDMGAENPKNSLFSFYNITGANLWQIVFLVVVMAVISTYFFVKKKDSSEDREIVKIFWEESWIPWNLVFWETIFLTFIFVFPAISGAFVLRGFNLCNIVFLCIWLYYIRHTYNSQPIQSGENRYKYFIGWNKYKLVAITILLWSLFGAFAYGNFYMASLFPLDSSTSFGVILSFITSSPEFSVLCFLFRQREYRIAVGGFFGSSLFNLTLPFYSNLISSNPIMGKELSINIDDSHVLSTTKIGMWLMSNVIFLFLFLVSFNEKGGRFGRITKILNGILVVSLYIFVICFFNKSRTSWA